MPGSRTTPIVIPSLDNARAKRYSRVRLVVLTVSTLWSAGQLLWFASDRRAARLNQAIERRSPHRRLAGLLFFIITSLLAWLASLPVSYLGGHLVERRFALTRQPTAGWLADRLKALFVGLAVQPPLLLAAYGVIQRRPRDWWLILSGAAVPLTVIFSNLAPVLLMPIFNRFVPPRDAALAERTRALARRAGVKISDVYEMDMSRQSEKPNAMFTGLGRTKRIILGDTLLSRFAPDEIDAVVAHELGHQVHGDIWRLIGFSAGAGFATAWLTSRLAPAVIDRTRRQTGVTGIGDEASLPILTLLLMILGVILMPIQAAFSRAMERRADAFALALTGNGEAYARAMERLATLSLADPDPSRFVVFMLYSHPPISERIATARRTHQSRVQEQRETTIDPQRG